MRLGAIKILLPGLVLLTSLAGCGVNNPLKSIGDEVLDPDSNAPIVAEGTWGHLAGGRSKWLIQQVPGTAIKVCGQSGTELVPGLIEGLKAWRDATGRGTELQVLAGCDSGEKATRVVSVYGHGSPEAKAVCGHYPKAVALTYVDQGTVVICSGSEKMPEVMLHEAGHLWGMCDVYPEDIVGTGNCDSRFYTGRSRSSVMGANYSRLLSEADLVGARKLSDRPDLAGNAHWKTGMSQPSNSITPQSTGTEVGVPASFQFSPFTGTEDAVCVLRL